MDPQQEVFERDLLTKLQFKASSNISVENLLLKIFKFFDLSGQGEIRKPDFLKVIAKCGVVLEDQDLADKLFNIYSKNQPTIHYRDFINNLLFGSKPLSELGASQIQQNYQERVGQVTPTKTTAQLQTSDLRTQGYTDQPRSSLEVLKTQLNLKGNLSLLSLVKRLKDIVPKGNITSQQFFQALGDVRVDIDKNAQIAVFMQADKYQNGTASVDELIGIIKGKLPIYRVALLKQIFESFGTNEIPIGYLIKRFNAENHPDVRHYNRNPNELHEEFAMALELYTSLTQQRSQTLDVNAFIDFYHMFGYSITNDEVFRSQLVSVWNQDHSSPPRIQNKAHIESKPDDARSQVSQFDQRSQVPKSIASSQTTGTLLRQVELIVQRIKNRLATRGAKGFISMYRALKMLDVDRDGQLNIHEFRKAIKDHRIEVTDSEIDMVFSYFDRDQIGLIDLWGILFVFKGELSPQRSAIVEQAFNKVDKDGRGQVQFSDIRAAFQAKYHPDVKSGKRQDDEIQNEFQDSFLMLHNINGGFGNEVIPKEEFFEYFSHFSAAVSDDRYFDQIMQQTFRLGNDSNLRNNYAGAGKKVFEPDHKKGYLQDHHRQVVSGGSVAANAPFGTFAEEQSVKSRPQTATQQYPQSNSFNIFRPLEDTGPKRVSQIQPQGQLQSDLTPKKAVENKTDFVEYVRPKIYARGIRGIIAIQKKLRQFDRQSLGSVAYPEFVKVFSHLRIPVSDQHVQGIFRHFEVEESGMMNYDGFIKSLQGTMSQRKFNALVQAFESFQSQKINYLDLIASYNPKNHPDVRGNRRKEDEVLHEFLETFEDNHKLFTNVDYTVDPLISFDEFINYYNSLSMVVDDDTQFEQMLSVWPQKTRR